MREIYVNGVAFRYRTERDLAIILRHAREPARLAPLCEFVQQIKRRQKLVNNFRKVDTQTDIVEAVV